MRSYIKPQLWHCHNTRSLRAVWAMEEMNIDYELHTLSFPPRVFDKSFLALNTLGTVPYLVHDKVELTESVAICQYLAQHYNKQEFLITPEEQDYGAFLNWLFHSDATLTFPQTIYLRYSQFESPERQLPQAAEDYRLWFLARLKRLNSHLIDRQYLCEERFTIADIAVGYALFLGQLLGFDADYEPQTQQYLKRLKERPAFIKASSLGKDKGFQIEKFNCA